VIFSFLLGRGVDELPVLLLLFAPSLLPQVVGAVDLLLFDCFVMLLLLLLDVPGVTPSWAVGGGTASLPSSRLCWSGVAVLPDFDFPLFVLPDFDFPLFDGHKSLFMLGLMHFFSDFDALEDVLSDFEDLLDDSSLDPASDVLSDFEDLLDNFTFDPASDDDSTFDSSSYGVITVSYSYDISVPYDISSGDSVMKDTFPSLLMSILRLDGVPSYFSVPGTTRMRLSSQSMS
jgi:hypothetical protein